MPSNLDLYTPKLQAVTIEYEYSRELCQELKQIKALARKSIVRAQASQYDKEAKESKISSGDLVMLS